MYSRAVQRAHLNLDRLRSSSRNEINESIPLKSETLSCGKIPDRVSSITTQSFSSRSYSASLSGIVRFGGYGEEKNCEAGEKTREELHRGGVLCGWGSALVKNTKSERRGEKQGGVLHFLGVSSILATAKFLARSPRFSLSWIDQLRRRIRRDLRSHSGRKRVENETETESRGDKQLTGSWHCKAGVYRRIQFSSRGRGIRTERNDETMEMRGTKK